MADPATIVGAAGIGTSLLGGLFGAAGAAQTGKAQQNQMLYQAGLAQINSQIDQQNANFAIEQGEQTAAKYGIGARQQAGQIKAAQSSGHLDVNSGSARDVQEAQRTVSQIDLNQIRTNAAKTAWNYEAQANVQKGQASLYQMGAADISKATVLNIASSLISTGSSVASKWLAGRQTGLWGSDSNTQSLGSGGDVNAFSLY